MNKTRSTICDSSFTRPSKCKQTRYLRNKKEEDCTDTLSLMSQALKSEENDEKRIQVKALYENDKILFNSFLYSSTYSSSKKCNLGLVLWYSEKRHRLQCQHSTWTPIQVLMGHFQSSSQLMCLGKQRQTDQVPGPT